MDKSGDEYAGEHNESEWHDSNDGFVEDGNMTDGYDPGDEYAGDFNESDEGAPVFYLTTNDLEALTGESGLPDGHYAVEEYMDWDEETQNEVFGYILEPVSEIGSGEWDYAGGDEEDGYEIVNYVTSEEELKGYFDSNLGEPVGYAYPEGPTTHPGGDDDWGDNVDYDGNMTDGYDPGDEYAGDFNESDEGAPVFYLTTNDLEALTESLVYLMDIMRWKNTWTGMKRPE